MTGGYPPGPPALCPMTATAFAPATVSNVACGFDVLGFAIERPGDRVTSILGPPPPIIPSVNASL